MAEPFIEAVTTRRWQHDVEAWIGDRVADLGRRQTAPIDRHRLRPWSIQLIVPTDRGRMWFKSNCAAMSFEAGLHQRLAELVPDAVHAPAAVDVTRGWMLTDDHGPTVADGDPAADVWTDLLVSTAHMQRELASHADTIVATGLPDCRPETVVDRFDSLVDRLAVLPTAHRSHLDNATRSALLASRSRVLEAADLLADSPVPPSLQHGDLHPGNVFADKTIFDFGDAQWAAAFEVLQVPRRMIAIRDDAPWDRLRDAYLDVWSDLIDRRDARSLAAATAVTQVVNRAATWADALDGGSRSDLEQWGNAPLETLTGLLRN